MVERHDIWNRMFTKRMVTVYPQSQRKKWGQDVNFKACPQLFQQSSTKVSTNFKNICTHWRPSIQTHESMENIAHSNHNSKLVLGLDKLYNMLELPD